MGERGAFIEGSVIVLINVKGTFPSIVGGLVDKPVIVVITSIGYGTGFRGISAHLGALNSCVSGITMVNIDYGFGAGNITSLINYA